MILQENLKYKLEDFDVDIQDIVDTCLCDDIVMLKMEGVEVIPQDVSDVRNKGNVENSTEFLNSQRSEQKISDCKESMYVPVVEGTNISNENNEQASSIEVAFEKSSLSYLCLKCKEGKSDVTIILKNWSHTYILFVGFFSQSDLDTHMIAHPHDDVPFCSLCQKNYINLKSLKRHVRTHIIQKKFSCNFCKKTFSESGNLTRHVRKHVGEKKHFCSTCGRRFYEAGRLKEHMRMHSGEKPVQCDICLKSFTTKNALKSHLKSHSDERKYSCEFCKKCFKHSFVLTQHLKIHSGKKPYSCEICGKSFSQVSTYSITITK